MLRLVLPVLLLPPAAAHAAGGSSEGMPQLAFGNPLLLAQVVWLLVIFGGLYWALSRIVLPRVDAVIEAREARIAADLDAAQKAKQEADRAIEAYREATRRARAEAQAKVAEAVAKAEAEQNARTDAILARFNETLREADRRITGARNQAMGALAEVATDTAAALVSRLAGRADRARIAAAVNAEIAARAGRAL
ncbi:MAG: F0F1 ATP synthase subunit B' [Acetobacteraceae bacterium]|nr:F0F1 ATP synthase subunit B' [Acetobacteraceae bacterium]MCX7684904.1 F0F1 ATP synthase subunit B' [Acetobacteraceae bacterium]MDW8398078.1 F0F1 ATP synthase subunit B' [Acetobacteraceae bacterium]